MNSRPGLTIRSEDAIAVALNDGDAGLRGLGCSTHICKDIQDSKAKSNVVLHAGATTLSNKVCFGAESVKLLQTKASPEGGGSFLPPLHHAIHIAMVIKSENL